MKFTRHPACALLLASALLMAACGGGDDGATPVAAPPVQGTEVTVAQMNDIDLNKILADAKEGDTITLPAGKYNFKGPLQITNKKRLSLVGAGNGTDPAANTILSFSKALTQNGIDASGLEAAVFRKFAVEDASGNGVFINQSRGVVLDTLRAEWTINPFGTSRMAYGLYPVSSDDVKVVNSRVVGTRDAGVYVGQSTNILVANNVVANNVAGVEIENSHNAIVENNLVHDNTGGILIFALKAPPRFKDTKNILVRNNTIIDNNTPPFANASGLVLTIPPGTGILVLASQNVEITGNTISRHKTTGVLVISAFTAGEQDLSGALDSQGKPYDNFGRGTYIHRNTIVEFGDSPGGAFALASDQGGLKDFTDAFMGGYGNFPAVIWDGVVDPVTGVGVDVSTGLPVGGDYTGNLRVCSKSNSVTAPANGVVPSYENLNMNLFGLLTGTGNFSFHPSPTSMDCTVTLPVVTGYPS